MVSSTLNVPSVDLQHRTGPSTYDVRCGWGRGVTQKQMRVLISCECDSDKVGEGVKKSEIFTDVI